MIKISIMIFVWVIVKIAKDCYAMMRSAQKSKTFKLAKNFKNQVISITMRRNNTEIPWWILQELSIFVVKNLKLGLDGWISFTL